MHLHLSIYLSIYLLSMYVRLEPTLAQPALRRSRRGNPAAQEVILSIYLSICLSMYMRLEPTLAQPAARGLIRGLTRAPLAVG